MKGYVYWELRRSNGSSQHGKEQFKIGKSSIHLRDQYTNIRTACNLRIPNRGNVTFENDVTKLPKGLNHCQACFK